MATSFPSGLDSFTNPTAVDTLDSPPHDTQHANANDAIEALQAKVGVNSSAVTSSHDYKITQLEAGATASSIKSYADSTARTTAVPSPTEGDFSYLQDTDSVEVYDGSAWTAVGGKILQVVRATDTTNRNTTSTSFVDASISVTITPTSATSNIIVIWSFRNQNGVGSPKRGQFQILHTGIGAIEGAEEANVGLEDGTANYNHVTIIGYSSPATTSACEYKGRFKTTAGTIRTDILNAGLTGTLWALEVSA